MGDTFIGFHPNEKVLSFQVSDVCAKFHQNRLKIATMRARSHKQIDTHLINGTCCKDCPHTA